MSANECKVIECEGKNGGTVFSNGDGYFYRIKEKRQHRWRLMCHKSKCKGIAVLFNVDSDERSIVDNALHSCEKNANFVKEIEVRNAILKRCREEQTHYSKIFLEKQQRGEF